MSTVHSATKRIINSNVQDWLEAALYNRFPAFRYTCLQSKRTGNIYHVLIPDLEKLMSKADFLDVTGFYNISYISLDALNNVVKLYRLGCTERDSQYSWDVFTFQFNNDTAMDEWLVQFRTELRNVCFDLHHTLQPIAMQSLMFTEWETKGYGTSSYKIGNTSFK